MPTKYFFKKAGCRRANWKYAMPCKIFFQRAMVWAQALGNQRPSSMGSGSWLGRLTT